MKSTRALFAAWCTVALAMTGACALGPYPPPAPPRHTELGIGITSFALPNGLRVVLVKDPHAAQVQVTMRYQVGAVDDLDKPGMAHLVEHLMFQQVLGGQTLFATLEDVTTYFNALTTWDATTYISRGPLARLDTLLSVEAVRLGFRCTSITESTFDREREVVVNEIRGNAEGDRTRIAVQRAAYPAGHPYGQSIRGDVPTVGAITFEDACKFVDSHYAPSNAVLVISGDITTEGIAKSLGKFIARVAKRMASAPAHVAEAPPVGRQVDAKVPIETNSVLIAWPMPTDPEAAIKVRTIKAAVKAVVDSQVEGAVYGVDLGDARAPMYGLLIEQTGKETADDVVSRAKKALELLPYAFRRTGFRLFDDITFDRVRQISLYDLYASLEEGGDRDTNLAAHVLAGRDPVIALSSEFAGVRALGPEEGVKLVENYFDVRRATVVKLTADIKTKTGREIALRPEIHDMGQRRTLVDPGAAHQPVAGTTVTTPPGMRQRQLPNGMTVVLLPSTSVPAIDIRLVFRTGSADEPATKRGVANVAAHALDWDVRYLNDMIAFTAAGGTSSVEVTGDHTSFLARGVDMHIDVLLAGLRRWVREGRYTHAVDDAIEELRRRARKRVDEQEQLTRTLMAAIFGASHPYAGALPTAVTLTGADVDRFRTAHYTPDNATLVIAGRFDADLADKWIDYLFADWSGHAAQRSQVPNAIVQVASLAKFEDLAQVYVAAALPIAAKDYPQQLVAAEVLEELADSIRQELGASYGVHAELAESRLARMYMVGGWIDASRATSAVTLLRDRIAALRSDPDAAARAFVTARSRVLARLSTFTGTSTLLTRRVEHDIDLERPPMSDLQTADAVRGLTIDDMTNALGDLDLTRALVLMRGPEGDVKSAFEALGRTPKVIAFDQAAADDAADDPNAGRDAATSTRDESDGFSFSDVETALTYQPVRLDTRLSLTVMPTLSVAIIDTKNKHFETQCCIGGAVFAHIGYRFDATLTLGLQLGIGRTTGTYTVDTLPGTGSLSLTPIDIGVLAEGNMGQLWGNASVGVHIDHGGVPDMARGEVNTMSNNTGLGIAIGGGVDVMRFGMHRLGVGAHLS
ncbi:MAG: insulinase family protein, partial [Kofleriaceae bacterium]|nr:insulinase family protein [Kofleriaceae bacterium]